MPTLAWVLAAGAGEEQGGQGHGLTLLLPEPTFKQLVLSLVALAAGSLVGGAPLGRGRPAGPAQGGQAGCRPLATIQQPTAPAPRPPRRSG
jgi:zinc and cadmium transporter